jgi:hypothetical protein
MVDSPESGLTIPVVFLPNGGMVPNYSIDATHISSLEIVNDPSKPSQVEKAQSPPPKAPVEFQDPAILSVNSPTHMRD